MFDFFHKNKNSQTQTNSANLQNVTNTTQTQSKTTQISNFQQPQNPIQTVSGFQNQTTVSPQTQSSVQTQAGDQKTVVKPVTVINPQPANSTIIKTTTSASTTIQSTAYSDDDLKTIELINKLVMAILGYSIADIDEIKREQVIKDCVRIFSDYMIKFVELKYGPQDATRLRATQKFNDTSVFTKFADLGPKFDEAYSSFLEVLEKKWATASYINT